MWPFEDNLARELFLSFFFKSYSFKKYPFAFALIWRFSSHPLIKHSMSDLTPLKCLSSYAHAEMGKWVGANQQLYNRQHVEEILRDFCPKSARQGRFVPLDLSASREQLWSLEKPPSSLWSGIPHRQGFLQSW